MRDVQDDRLAFDFHGDRQGRPLGVDCMRGRNFAERRSVARYQFGATGFGDDFSSFGKFDLKAKRFRTGGRSQHVEELDSGRGQGDD